MKKFFNLILFSLFLEFSLLAQPRSAEGVLPSGPKPTDRPSVALVLAGGGAKGFAHLPIIELIEEIGIPIDMIVGTSIGSIVGGLYSSGYSIAEIMDRFDDVDWTPLFADAQKSPYEDVLNEHSVDSNLVVINFTKNFKPKMGKGVSKGQAIYELFKSMTLKYPSNQDFNKLAIPFRAVVCDMFNGEAMVIDNGDVSEAIRASMSLPGVFDPIEIDGHYFIDGGVRYNLAINVAKNMNYDIIIAVDISPKVENNLDVFSANPAVALMNTITIAQYTATQKMYDDANLVIFPDTEKFGILDFKKSKLIYEEGKVTCAKYEDQLEEIRKAIYPSDYDSDGKRISSRNVPQKKGKYASLEELVPTSFKYEGMIASDEKYIKKCFENISGKKLTEENFNYFKKTFGISGNYSTSRFHFIQNEETGETELFLKLNQKDAKEIKVLIDVDTLQILSSRGLSKVDLGLGLQLRGFTGMGSVLSLRTRSISDYSAELMFMQPFNSNFYFQAAIEAHQDRYPEVVIGTSDFDYSQITSFNGNSLNLLVGMHSISGNLFRLGAFANYIHTSDFIFMNTVVFYSDNLDDLPFFIGDTKVYSYGGFLDYTFDKMDREVFARKGLFANLCGKLAFPLDSEGLNDPVLLISGEVKGAVPLGKHVSFSASGFLGRDFLENMKDSPAAILTNGFSTFDRVYLPQISSENLASEKYGITASFQFEPWHQLTILGGDAILRLGGTLAAVTDSYKSMFNQTYDEENAFPWLWSASMGFGLKFKAKYTFFFRGGVASNYQKKAAPFFTLDFCSIRF